MEFHLVQNYSFYILMEVLPQSPSIWMFSIGPYKREKNKSKGVALFIELNLYNDCSESIAFYSLSWEEAVLKCPFFHLYFFFFLLLQYFIYYANKGENFVRFPDIFVSILLAHEIQRLATINLEKLIHMKSQVSVGCLKFLRMRKVKL